MKVDGFYRKYDGAPVVWLSHPGGAPIENDGGACRN